MTQYNTLNKKLPNFQLNKLKSGIKYGTEICLNLSSDVISGSNFEIYVSHKLLLSDTEVSVLRKAFKNNSSANIKRLNCLIW